MIAAALRLPSKHSPAAVPLRAAKVAPCWRGRGRGPVEAIVKSCTRQVLGAICVGRTAPPTLRFMLLMPCHHSFCQRYKVRASCRLIASQVFPERADGDPGPQERSLAASNLTCARQVEGGVAEIDHRRCSSPPVCPVCWAGASRLQTGKWLCQRRTRLSENHKALRPTWSDFGDNNPVTVGSGHYARRQSRAPWQRPMKLRSIDRAIPRT